MMSERESDFVTVIRGDGPLVATAVHDGHLLRPEIESRIQLTEPERLQEEDPFTGDWTSVAPTRIIGRHSRFEVDLNRPRDQAVYATPEDAWGLQLWSPALPPEEIEASLERYDRFYTQMTLLFEQLVEEHSSVIVLDLHSYNHRRDGADATPAEATENPTVNIGTGSMDRERWGSLVDRFIADLRSSAALDEPLDVRENVKFQGGHWPEWLHRTFDGDVCAIAVEFKKTFMDEWTGEPDTKELAAIEKGLASTIPGLLQERARQ